MTETELGDILKSIDAAIAVYQTHKGPLSASAISVKSMLMVLRLQVADELKQERSPTKGC